jgi:mono/diheme cytochrome c family protein
MKMTTWRIPHRFIAAACLAVLPRTVLADPPARTGAGRQLAQQYCAECHVLDPNDVRGMTDAPAFAVLANRPGTTEQTLSRFIQRPHENIPDTGRPPAEADAIAAYIMNMRKN